MGCYENLRGLVRVFMFVFNNVWEGGGGVMSSIGVISFMFYL